MADRDVLEKVARLCGGRVSGPHKTRANHHAPMYSWGVTGEKAVALLDEIYPLMSKRRQQKIIEVKSESKS